MFASREPVHVTHVISSLDVGGAETALCRLLGGLDKARVRSSVVCLSGIGEVGRQLEALGVPVHCLGMRSGLSAAVKLVGLASILRRLRPGIVQGWMYHGNILSAVASALLPTRPLLFWNVRSAGTHLTYGFRKELVYRLAGPLSRVPVVIITNSANAIEVHQRRWNYPGDRWVVIPNGFDTQVFRPDPDVRRNVRDLLVAGPETILIGHVARYDPMKDHRTLLLAARRLLSDGNDIRVVMIGLHVDGENGDLARTIAELGLRGRVHLLGLRKDVNVLMSGLDIGCSSSRSDEGFPNVVGEMMSTAVPCVVTDVGDSAHVVGKTGRVVPAGDPDALTAALQELATLGTEGRRELGASARQRIIANFSLSSIVARYEELYEQAFRERRIH